MSKIKIKKTIKNDKLEENTNIIKLENNIKEVKNIVHCADIHIKNDQSNRDEYNLVFERFYNSVKTIKNINETIIAICGDIFDNKTNLRPESIDLLKDFFYNLASITDVIVILGNHDQNSNNSKSLDAITPIIKGIESKFKIHLLKSGVYEYSNILFGVTDIHQDKVTRLDFSTDKIKVNLYHGYIHGAKLQNEESNLVGKFNQTDFSDGKYTLLGDIHKFQYLNKNKTMAYPSSLIQMNYGEEVNNHGYILWDLVKETSKFLQIKNDYAYYTIEINSNKLVTKIEKDLPNNIRLRVFYRDTSIEKRQEIIEEFREKYNIVQLDEIKQMKGINLELSENNKKIQEITSINNVNDLIMKYIQDKNEGKFDESKIKELSQELNSITKKIDYNFEKTKKNIKIKKLEFNNMFIYGENNVINFDNLDKIVGLIAENKRGKTSLIDCILFSIWSESDRTISNVDIIKHGTKKMTSDIILSVNETNYKISRQSYYSKGRLYNEVNLYEYDKNTSEEIKITESDKKKTEEKIINIFGTYEDFTLLSIITQDNPINFLTMKDTEKKALLNKMFNLEIIKDVNREVNKEHLALTKINKEYDNINKENDLTKLLETIEKLNTDKKDINEKYIKKCEEREKIKKEITVLEYKLNENQIEQINDIDEIKEKLDKLNSDIEKNTNLINDLENKISNINNELLDNKSKLDSYDDIENKYKLWKKEKKEKLNKLNDEYQELTNMKKPIRALTKQETKEKKQLSDKLDELLKEKEEIEEKYEEYDNYDLIDEYNKKIEKIEETEIEINNSEKKIKDNENLLKKMENHKFNKDCEACMSNSITKQKILYQEEIEKNKKEIETQKSNKLEIEKFINKKKKTYNKLKESKELKEKLDIIENEIKNNKNEIKNYNKLEKEFNNNSNFNKDINEKIQKNRNSFNELENSKYENYDEYLEVKEQYNNNNVEITELKEKLINITSKNDKLKIKKVELDDLINKYNKNKKIYDEIEKNKILLEEKQNEEKKIDIICKESMIKISNINKELSKYDTNIQLIEKNKEIISKNNKRKEILGIIKSATDSGGILDEILKDTIIPSIQNIVNEILSNVDTYKIKINYDSFIKITKIENNTEQESSGLMASGHEKSVLNIIFRLALSKLNSMVSTNFFIIDEAFKNSDSNKKQKLKTLFEYLRNNYDWALIVTHDDYIKDNFDKEINIEYNNASSFIKY